MEDTIAAISTPLGTGGIAIIRVSGAQALSIADAIFVSPRGSPAQFHSHTVHFGSIASNCELVDQVMLVVMRAPRSYTTEDVVEIQCHGGLLTANKILALCLHQGARLAEPGEFTKRAFLNGRLDLTQAEAVMDLIAAKTERARAAAVHALEGRLFHRVEELRQRLLDILAHIEAHIDFPDEDIIPNVREKLQNDIEQIISSLEGLLATAHEGRILREGISIAIVGRPNVGKSSLMNALLGEARSIVTPHPGTTRDTIEETANIHGFPIRITDTAGIRDPKSKVERLGVERSRNKLLHSDICILVLDASRRFSVVDRELDDLCRPKPVIKVLNKIDLPYKFISPTGLLEGNSVRISSTTGEGIDHLKKTIEQQILSGRTGASDLGIAVSERQAEALRQSISALNVSLEEFKQETGLELIAQQLRLGLNAVGEIVGKYSTEDILDKLFGTFCIGK